MRQKWIGCLVAAAVWMISSGLVAVPVTRQADTQQIVVDNFTFTPATISVPVGSTITWTNRDDIPHTVVSTEQRFKSQAIDTDQEYSHRFDTAGTYKYFCSIHPKMTAQIVVK